MAIKRILVPVDFSDTSLKALDHAIEWAAAFKAEILVLFVVEPIYYASPSDLYGSAANIGVVLQEQERIAREQMERLSVDLEKRGVTFRTTTMTGTPYLRIVEAADQQKADLIVIATHGRTGLSHMLMGSVAEKVVRTAVCPVLSVRVPTEPARGDARKK